MNIEQQIEYMKEARLSHKQWYIKLINNPDFDSKLVGDTNYQLEWVKIYDNVLESLVNLLCMTDNSLKLVESEKELLDDMNNTPGYNMEEYNYYNKILSNNMKQVKVINDFFGLKPGSILNWDEDKDVYVYKSEDRTITESGEHTTNNIVMISADMVDALEGADVEYINEPKELTWDDANFVKPLAVKVRGFSDTQVELLTTTKEIVYIDIELFNRLFKVIV